MNGRARHEALAQICSEAADARKQAFHGAAMAVRRDPPGSLAVEAVEANRPAEVARHAASVAVVAQQQCALDALVVHLDVGVVADAARVGVGDVKAGLGQQYAGYGGAPCGGLGAGRDGIAPAQRLLREGGPHRAGEIAAEGGQSDHRMLGAVHAPRQRRH